MERQTGRQTQRAADDGHLLCYELSLTFSVIKKCILNANKEASLEPSNHGPTATESHQ